MQDVYASFIEPHWMREYNYINSTGLSFIYIHSITDRYKWYKMFIVSMWEYIMTLNIVTSFDKFGNFNYKV